MCFSLHNTLSSAIETIPKTIVQTSARDKPWITPLCKLLIQKRWAAFRKKDFILYKHYKMKVRTEIKSAKNMWYENCKSKVGGLWNVVKSAAPKKAKNITSLKEENESVKSFCNRINDTLLSNYKFEELQKFPPKSDKPILDITLSAAQIFNELFMLKRNKSTGSDGLPNVLLKSCAHLISHHVLHIFNNIINQCTYPSSWKCSDIVPLPKSNPVAINKIRPISLLPNISKVFEKILLSYLKPFFCSYIDSNQHGFMPKSSTSTCLIHIQDSITAFLDEPFTTAVTIISFDLRKAFDLVSHNILLDKLSLFMPSNILSLMHSYLCNRTQRVRLNGVTGSPKQIPSGVPQGSILSPFLFNSFFNDLAFHTDAVLLKYADDVTLLIPHIENNISVKINSHISQMNQWCLDNNLLLNTEKTQIMTVMKSKSVSRHLLHSPTIKILGVTFNEKLKWNTHINNIFKKASQRIHIIRKLKYCLSKQELIVIYKAFIQSILLYACELFIKLPQSLEAHCNRITKRCHRIICHPTCTCNLIQSPSSLRQRHAVRLFNKALCDPNHPVFHLIPHRLKYSGKFCQPNAATERRRMAFIPTVTSIINNS